MPCKLTLFFNQANHGFSETFYSLSNDPVEFTTTAYNDLWTAAAAFRAPPTRLFAMRASLIGGNRQTAIKYLGALFGPVDPGDSTPETVQVTWQTALFGPATQRRFLEVRGIYDDSVKRDQAGNDMPTAYMVTSMTAYVRSMVSHSLQIQTLVQPPVGGIAFTPVLSVAPIPLTPNTSEITLASAPTVPYVPGQVVRWRGVPYDSLPGFPKSATIISVGGAGPLPTYRINYNFRNTQIQFPPKMTSCPLVYQYVPISSFFQFVRFSSRQTGRPFGSLRGTTRAKIRRT